MTKEILAARLMIEYYQKRGEGFWANQWKSALSLLPMMTTTEARLMLRDLKARSPK